MFKSELWQSMDSFKGIWHSNPTNIYQAGCETSEGEDQKWFQLRT